MMHKKLYIPTTTLNFNSILASESISPAAFYSVRGFGYKRWDKVEPNKLDKRIVLYDKFPNFQINDEEYENYPLVIEIDTKSIGEDIIQEYKDGVYFSEETIYLNPFSTQIIFNNEIDKRKTLSKVAQSLNTKLVAIYENNIVAKGSGQSCFDWKELSLLDSESDISHYIAKDRKINKLKGLLYAYLLGGNKSLSPVTVSLRKNVKMLESILSAVITSPDSQISYQQHEQLKTLYQLISDKFLLADDNSRTAIIQKLERHKIDHLIDIFREEGILSYWCSRKNIKPQFQFSPFSVLQSTSAEDKLKALDDYFLRITNEIKRIIRPEKLFENDLPTLRHNQEIESIGKNPLLPKLFNEYLNDVWSKDEFIAGRIHYATAGGKIFKEELEAKNQWENSTYKEYINSLRRNLASHTPFSVNSTDNHTLKSFACFCQKGEEDIDKLEDYLISNEISDFKIAFALWGTILGFANMPKTLTNELFLSDDLEYISNIYKYIFKQIHGIELKGELKRIPAKDFSLLPSRINEQAIHNSGVVATTAQQKYSKETLEFYEKIKSKCKGVENDKEAYLLYIEENGVTMNLLNILKSDQRLNKGKGVQKTVIDIIEKKMQPIRTKAPNSTKPEPKLSFGYQLEHEFYRDRNAFELLSNLLPRDSKIQKQFKIDLDWFQNEYRKDQKSKYYATAKRDNESVIEAFRRYLEKKNYATMLNINKIMDELHKLYK